VTVQLLDANGKQVVCFAFQRYFVQGLLAGFVK